MRGAVIGRTKRELAGQLFRGAYFIVSKHLSDPLSHDERANRFNPGAFFANDLDELCNCEEEHCKSEGAQQNQ
jgi:hypothetical protein